MATKYVDYADLRIAYTSEGRGEPVVLVHGFCEDSYVWDEFRHDLLEEQYRVIRIDLPGFGQSIAGPRTVEGYAQAVEAVLQHLNLGRVTFVGHSLGGYVGLALAELFPDRLRGLGLFHSHPYADSGDKRANREKSIDFIERQGHWLFVKQLMPNLFSERYAASHPFLIDKLTFRASRAPGQGIINALRAMADRPDRSEVLRSFPRPVLFLVGLQDKAVPPAALDEQLALPAIADIHVFESVAHMGMFEATRPCQLALRRFIDFCQQY